MPNAELVALDTMNLWIEHTRDSLVRTIKVVDVVIINDAPTEHDDLAHDVLRGDIQTLLPQLIL